MIKKLGLFFILVLTVISVTGCSDENKEKKKEHSIIEVKANEDIVIKTSDINENATYYNYVTEDNVTIQIFAVKATDGTVRVVFNTCGACNPAPTAYFIQDGDYFVCQNCENRFHRDDIGLSKTYGCSPISILDENKIVEEDTITIASDFLETYKKKFESIKIYKN